MSWKAVRETMIVVIGVGMFLVLTQIDKRLELNNVNLDRNYQTTLENRATGCRLQLGLGFALRENCTVPEMAPYFDPDEDVQTGTMRLICQVLSQNDPTYVLPEGCPGARKDN